MRRTVPVAFTASESFDVGIEGILCGMTTTDEQLRGDAANFANAARGQITAWVDKLDVLAREGRDLLEDMDARLEKFDRYSRRLTETTAEQRA